jgi:glycosyltransferase involved in cell wall biosynthesis
VTPNRARWDNDPVRVVRIIARLNIGGPAIQAITLTHRMAELGYATTLVRGREELDEGNMNHLADELGVRPVLVRTLRRNPGLHDLGALVALIRIIRRERPQIVHTHAAKGGTLGRLAALLAFPRKRDRPVVIHTFHGHSLTGYFSPRTTDVYRRIEQLLARFSDRLIAVSDEVRDELVTMRVASESKFSVVPLGFDLSPFTVEDPARQQLRDRLRAQLGVRADARLVTLIARLVPIKRVDRFLRVANALRDLPDIRFLIVGDGELRDSLKGSVDAVALEGQLVWTGFRRDMPSVYFASDLVVQTSDNEGTPVSLIEAQAAGVPVVSTRVGGTQSVVEDTRFLIATTDEQGLARAMRMSLEDQKLAAMSAVAGRSRALARFDIARLISDIDAIYKVALENRGTAARHSD